MLGLSNHVKPLLVTIALSSCIVILVWVIYCITRFEQISHSIMIRKRHPNLLRIEALFIVLNYLIAYPLMALDWSHLPAFEGTAQQIIARLNITLFPPCTIGGVISLLWRFWHSFYDLKYSSSHKNSEWKYHLDPALVQHDFWLVHKRTFGSPRYTKTPVIAFYCANTAIIVLSYHLTVDTVYICIAHGMTVLPGIVVACVISILWWKIPTFSDDFLIKTELQLICLALLFGAPFAGIIIFYSAIYSQSLIMLGLVFSCIVVVFIISAASLWYVPEQIRQMEIQMDIDSRNRDHSDDHEHGSQHSMCRLQQILCNEEPFKLFMQHLTHEVSTECLLCFVEIVQFELAMKERIEIVDREVIANTINFANTFTRFDAVPKSSLIRKGFEQNLSKYKSKQDVMTVTMEGKMVARKLFEKYIDYGSELVVNISFEERTKLQNLMGDASVWMACNITPAELYVLYDEVALDMYRLMDGAFMRFALKREFKKACSLLDQACTLIKVQYSGGLCTDKGPIDTAN
eukprot:713126_1